MSRKPALGEMFTGMRREVVWATQIAIFALSGVLAFLLRFDFKVPPLYLGHLAYALVIWIAVKTVAFRVANLNRGWWQYVSITDLLRIMTVNCVSSAISCAAILWIAPPGFPRSIYLVDLMVCFLGTAGARMFVRMAAETISKGRSSTGGRNVLIYGAGTAGVTLYREIQNNPKLRYQVLGFLDDRRDKTGVSILGSRVLGTGDQAQSLVAKHDIDLILIAIPSATGTQMTRILERCHEAVVEFKTVPGLSEVIQERGLAGQIREVAVEDLLGRNPVRLEEDQILTAIAGRSVLVTGAAGSIGSELCRQIARFKPQQIIGMDIAESPLFEIDGEMKQSFPNVPFFPVIGNIQNRRRLNDILGMYSPSLIYHAAAYKHVPMMEAHVFEAIENNVLGTYNVAVAAAEHGVDDVVMISSDKAVGPTNMMGATKRIAELLFLALRNGRTNYVAVRFGNVLGSNGSVIPVFKKQIAAGGPVTVTHPEMRRFFMTIPEACQLVLQASTIGKDGQICVLDMGEPVKIVDLARNLILLSGLRPDEDIKIKFTGIRPGEKLCEELSTLLEDTVPTLHEKIRIFTGNGMPEGSLLAWIDYLREICETRDSGQLIVAVKEIVHDYSPSAHLLKRAIRPQGRRAISTVA